MNNKSVLHNKTSTDSAEFRAITLKKANKLYNTGRKEKTATEAEHGWLTIPFMSDGNRIIKSQNKQRINTKCN